jgi:serine/threonine-protein kinase PknG
VLEAALAVVVGGASESDAILFDRPVTERELRFGLEQTYRRLARLETVKSERVALVDRANQIRPRTLL